MRYRIKDYVINKDILILQVRIPVPAEVFAKFTYDEETGYLDTASTQYVTESIRLITDETQNGYVVMSSGQKGVLYGTSPIYPIRGNNRIGIDISLRALIHAADGDEDDIAAINAMSSSDQFTIEVDWGESPEDMDPSFPTDYAKDSTVAKDATVAKEATSVQILREIYMQNITITSSYLLGAKGKFSHVKNINGQWYSAFDFYNMASGEYLLTRFLQGEIEKNSPLYYMINQGELRPEGNVSSIRIDTNNDILNAIADAQQNLMNSLSGNSIILMTDSEYALALADLETKLI